ncbi:MAG: glucosaminidase domain-containing protein, partial [Chitinophagaceae bacterium]
MQNTRLLFIFVMLAASLAGRAQGNETILQYISTYKEMAIAEMQRTGVPASIKLAQGIHETTAGTSELVKKSNNHFGIKCKANWSGPSVSHDDDLRGECFRKYEDPMDSYRDHSDFLKGGNRYASLFQLDPMDYEDWAYGLKKAGYATNPKYPLIIIKLIETYHLQDYTLIAMGKMQDGQETLAKNTTQPKKEQSIESVTKNTQPAAITKEQPSYPSGEFRINETRVIFAKKNTPMLVIAQEYHVALKRLFDFNEMEETEELQKDQLLYLQRKRKTGTHEFHTVEPGETLEDIAMTEAIRMESLLEYNYLG